MLDGGVLHAEHQGIRSHDSGARVGSGCRQRAGRAEEQTGEQKHHVGLPEPIMRLPAGRCKWAHLRGA